jgi:hypothetical protein
LRSQPPEAASGESHRRSGTRRALGLPDQVFVDCRSQAILVGQDEGDPERAQQGRQRDGVPHGEGRP